MAASKNIRYIPAIDHLRAYAAVLVLVYHSVFMISRHLAPVVKSNPNYWPRTDNPLMAFVFEGHTGVALFIVLSGFIFTYGSAGKQIVYGTFLLNRVLRIYPLMMVLTFVGISAFTSQFTLIGFIQTLLPLQNEAGGLAIGAYNAMFWTIAVEFQFYLIFPFLYRRLLTQGMPALLGIIVLMLVARFSALLLGANPRDFSYWTILGRLDQFLIGMVAAQIARRVTLESRVLRWALPVGVVGLGGALLLFNHAGGWISDAWWKICWPPVEAVFWAAIILGYLAVRQGRHGLISRALAGLGTISYSMYLTHFVIITIIIDHGLFYHVRKWAIPCALLNASFYVLPVTVLVSTLTYHAVEKPFLGMRRKYLETDATPPAVAT